MTDYKALYEQSKATNAQYEADLATLAAACDSLRSAVRQKDEECAKCIEAVTTLSSTLEEEVRAHEAFKLKYSADVQALRSVVASQQESHEKDTALSKRRQEEASQVILALRNEFDAKTATITELQIELQAKSIFLSKLELVVSGLEGDIQSKNTIIDHLESQLTATSSGSDYSSLLRQTVSQLESELRVKAGEVLALQQRESALRNQLDAKQDQVSHLQGTLDAATDAATRSVDSDRQLRSTVSSCEDTIAFLRAKLSDVQGAHDRLQAALHTKESTITRLEQTLAAEVAASGLRLDARISTVKQEAYEKVAVLEARLIEARQVTEANERLIEELRGVNAQLTEATKARKAAESADDALRQEQEQALIGAQNALRAKEFALSQALSELEIKAMVEAQLEALLARQTEAWNEQMGVKNASERRWLAEKEALQEALAQLQSENLAVSATRDDLGGKLAAALTRNGELDASVGQLTRRIDELTRQSSESEALQSASAQRQRETDRLLAEAQTRIVGLEAMLKGLNERCETATTALENKCNILRKKESLTKELKAEVTHLSRLSIEWKETEARQTETIAKQWAEISSQNETVKRLSDDVREASARLQTQLERVEELSSEREALLKVSETLTDRIKSLESAEAIATLNNNALSVEVSRLTEETTQRTTLHALQVEDLARDLKAEMEATRRYEVVCARLRDENNELKSKTSELSGTLNLNESQLKEKIVESYVLSSKLSKSREDINRLEGIVFDANSEVAQLRDSMEQSVLHTDEAQSELTERVRHLEDQLLASDSRGQNLETELAYGRQTLDDCGRFLAAIAEVMSDWEELDREDHDRDFEDGTEAGSLDTHLGGFTHLGGTATLDTLFSRCNVVFQFVEQARDVAGNVATLWNKLVEMCTQAGIPAATSKEDRESSSGLLQHQRLPQLEGEIHSLNRIAGLVHTAGQMMSRFDSWTSSQIFTLNEKLVTAHKQCEDIRGQLEAARVVHEAAEQKLKSEIIGLQRLLLINAGKSEIQSDEHKQELKAMQISLDQRLQTQAEIQLQKYKQDVESEKIKLAQCLEENNRSYTSLIETQKLSHRMEKTQLLLKMEELEERCNETAEKHSSAEQQSRQLSALLAEAEAKLSRSSVSIEQAEVARDRAVTEVRQQLEHSRSQCSALASQLEKAELKLTREARIRTDLETKLRRFGVDSVPNSPKLSSNFGINSSELHFPNVHASEDSFRDLSAAQCASMHVTGTNNHSKINNNIANNSDSNNGHHRPQLLASPSGAAMHSPAPTSQRQPPQLPSGWPVASPISRSVNTMHTPQSQSQSQSQPMQWQMQSPSIAIANTSSRQQMQSLIDPEESSLDSTARSSHSIYNSSAHYNGINTGNQNNNNRSLSSPSSEDDRSQIVSRWTKPGANLALR